MRNIIENKSFEFAVRIVNLRKFLVREKNEYILSKQLMRSGTSIGANVSEAQRAQSKADFVSKMSIALKEANETNYWLKLLYRTDYIDEKQFGSMVGDLDEIISILVSICNTSKQDN
ncbi:MAG: four helix bundle protein [Clostridia bacterium]|nr:four helix bundle protein [Clostridia bacterium]